LAVRARSDCAGDAWAAVDVDWTSQCLVQDPTVGCSAVGATRRDRGVDWVTSIYDPPTKALVAV
jgi:hypothetical protein